jgi:hypothetical protein
MKRIADIGIREFKLGIDYRLELACLEDFVEVGQVTIGLEPYDSKLLVTCTGNT